VPSQDRPAQRLKIDIRREPETRANCPQDLGNGTYGLDTQSA
jgi:hypothetical protein